MKRVKSATMILAALALLLGGVGHVRAGVVFSDNFNAGASPLWGNELGNWTASGGDYFAQSPNNNPPTYSSLPFNLTNFTFDVDINNVGDGGIWLHSSDQKNGILLVTGGNGYGAGSRIGDAGTDLYFHVISNGSVSGEYDRTEFLFTPGSDIHLHVVVTGEDYFVYLNGSSTPTVSLTPSMIAPQDTAAFDSFSSGKVGLYDFSAQTFDNVVLTSPVPEPSTLTLFGLGVVGMAVYGRRRRKRP